VKAEDTGVKITKTGADTIATFQAVATNAQATAEQITAAFDAALAGVKTVDEAKALGDAIESAAQRGVVGLKELASANRDVEERIRTLTAQISPLASQFELLGIKSQAQLLAARDNARDAFETIQEGARKGVAAQKDVVRAFKALADAERAAVADSDESAKQRVEDQLRVKASVLGIADAMKQTASAGEAAGEQLAESLGEVEDAAKAAASAIGDVAAAAIKEDRIGKEAAAANAAFAGSIGGVAAVSVEATAALHRLTELLRQDASLQNVGLTEAQYLLKTLGPLAGDAAQLLAARINELEQAARAAADVARNMADQAASLQDQIDELEGNKEDIENRRHKKALADLKAEAEAEGKQNSAEYFKLVALENKLHDLKLRNLKKERDAEGNTGPTNGGGIPRPGGAGRPTGGAPAPAPSPGPGPTTAPVPAAPLAHGPITVNLDGAMFLSGDSSSRKQLAALLARDIDQQLQLIYNRRR
jgi:hypothetical protein